ncbi:MULTISPECIES: hypothetical protein [unclassified Moraxella]|uniref:hypothetical protein n=1 Tax=unclassified Moraxella TaxID=2685852 RepID=UPI003AF538E2
MPRQDARYYNWKGVGRAIAYSVDIRNGDTVYNVNHAYDTMTQEYYGGVNVELANQKHVEIQCNPKAKTISKLDTLKNVPSGYE